MDRPGHSSAADTDCSPRIEPPRRPWLSDAVIDDIAAEIARALPLPPPDDQSTRILARAAELPDEDEERVVRAPAQRPRAGCARRLT